VLCLLGLCLGDVIGLPFELSSHRKNRDLADKAAEDCEAKLRYLLLDLITERLGRAGPTNAYARTSQMTQLLMPRYQPWHWLQRSVTKMCFKEVHQTIFLQSLF